MAGGEQRNPFEAMSVEQGDVLRDLLTDYVGGKLDGAGYNTRGGDIYLPTGVELLKALMERFPELFDQDCESEQDRAIASAEASIAKFGPDHY